MFSHYKELASFRIYYGFISRSYNKHRIGFIFMNYGMKLFEVLETQVFLDCLLHSRPKIIVIVHGTQIEIKKLQILFIQKKPIKNLEHYQIFSDLIIFQREIAYR